MCNRTSKKKITNCDTLYDSYHFYCYNGDMQ